MQAFFIGQTYIDVTFLTDRLPAADEKHVASAYAVSFGGNAVTAAFCCAKLSIAPALLTTVADDWLGRMFLEMAAKYEIKIHPRNVRTSSLSFIMPKAGQRAIVRCRDDDHLNSFPVLDLSGCRALHRSSAGRRDPLCEAHASGEHCRPEPLMAVAFDRIRTSCFHSSTWPLSPSASASR
jgi:sugar/nucleoside kinase (ribokinase family)